MSWKALFSFWTESTPGHALTNEAPLRAELFSVEQLVRHAKALAEHHQFVTSPCPNRLLARLDENEQILRSYNHATQTAGQTRRVTHAAEWLLDNFYLIEEQVQMARRHLPRGYSQELPRLVVGSATGLPRVYDLVLELISHVDAQMDAEPLRSFLIAYQSVSPLKLGELWAVPIMLRLALIENLRRVTTRLMIDRRDRDLADGWVQRLEEMAENNPSHLVVVIAEMAQSTLPVSSAFVAELCQRLSRQSPMMHLARTWLDQRLIEQGLVVEQLVQLESQNQAADQITVSHTINSLRFLGALDWRDFVEGLSEVEKTLRLDPAGVYAAMDFFTRDRYRHSVEAISRHSQTPEAAVARQAIQLAEESARVHGNQDRAAHVGFYLIDKGLTVLERAVGGPWTWPQAVERCLQRFPLSFYAGGALSLTLLATVGLIVLAHSRAAAGWKLLLLTPIVLLCSSQLAVALMNWVSTLLFKPVLLPRLDYSEGIAASSRTLVVVPTLLTSSRAVDRLLESLEIHYLANRDPNLYFALLTDFQDANEPTKPDDKALLDCVRSGVGILNRKYRADRPNLFFLFHRPRRWNEVEQLWMGYERKRGKLTEFNALLRGGSWDCFSEIVGDTSILSTIQFVITLDSDTHLPRDAARKLAGTLAHPLNRPRFDPVKGLVIEGYSILQPRVGISLPSASRSWFVKLFAEGVGIDPYTRAVSDVYQDLFREGSFIGKGIYDVDAFQQALAGRFPENAVLSHDLIEACHARSGLVSDVELYEDYPSRYNTDVNRRHRWIRGDWQIAQWLLPRVPGPDARRIANPLSGLSRWKILDNLRRSLIPAALLALLAGSWLFFPGFAEWGPLLVLAVLAVPALLTTSIEIFRKPRDASWRLHMLGLARSCGRQLARGFLTLVFLPYDAYVSLDAVARTVWRLLVTRKRLLEWQTAGEAERMAHTGPAGFYVTMWNAPVVGLVCAVLLALWQRGHWPLAAPVLGLWVFSPWIAWRISQPIAPSPSKLSKRQRAFLRRMARKTWHFFETFVTAQESWLPPDNFQEEPVSVVASRTSPTNMGLALLANLSARDFGYLSVGQLVGRTQNALATMRRLERHRGHFYNWYDTRTLKPLLPLYISSVDSGNLAGHLMTLSPGLRELTNEKLLDPQLFSGLSDTAAIVREFGTRNPELDQFQEELTRPPNSLRSGYEFLQRLERQALGIEAALPPESEEQCKRWTRLLIQNCRDHLEDLLFVAPWLGLSAVTPGSKPGQSNLGPGGILQLQSSRDPGVNGWPEGLHARLIQLDERPTLREAAGLEESLCPLLAAALRSLAKERSASAQTERRCLTEWLECLREASRRAIDRILLLENLARECEELAEMDFRFLFDPGRDLFSIGYNVGERRSDPSFYDLLASEARLCSYVVIAQGQVSQDHWFSLGRLLVALRGDALLASWNGSMFEYLMPLLVMPNYENTLLDHTCKGAVQQQIEYGQLRGVSWGISESGYNRTDVHLNYQYRAFGVPGLGLKRGLAEDLVVAPYAAVMALMVAPGEACENLERLAAEGREGAYGFYEAVDYTASRLPPGQSSVTIRSFMAHHQGMSLLALGFALLDQPMQRRFMACPSLRAAALLLQERVPQTTAKVLPEEYELAKSGKFSIDSQGLMRVFKHNRLAAPEVHLLSNGRYHVVISEAGGGYSRWRDLAVTRWREDATRDCWGTFIYLRDVETGEFWSATPQPVWGADNDGETIFTQARAEFRQHHGDLEIHMEISVSPEDDIELRRVTLTNHSHERRILEVTSYAEVVLAPFAADAAHPVFSNLFVQTEIIGPCHAILCTRRARSAGEKPPWLVSLLTGDGENDISCETDRGQFIGRGRTLGAPAALEAGASLSNHAGAVLDPMVALRRTVTVAGQGRARLDLIMGIAETREAALGLAEKYQNPRLADRAFDLAWTHSQVTLRHLNCSEAEAQLYAKLASPLIYANPARRAASSVLLSNRRGQNALWGYGISGDLPIVLLSISDSAKIEIVQQLMRAHSYWRMKGLVVDLVILNEDASVYRQPLQEEIMRLIGTGLEAPLLDKPGGVFVRHFEQVSSEDRVLLQSVARLVLSDEMGALSEQLTRTSVPAPVIPSFVPTRNPFQNAPGLLPPRPLIFSNGRGGFTADGREYIISLGPDQTTPAPWVNVLANPYFGTVISESGSAYTWVENCHEFRLTPWYNDPVTDATGEAFYLRDEETGQFWSPTPLPARGAAPYVIRHGFGYSVFEHTENGIASELTIFVAIDAPVKFAILKLRNLSGRPRRVSATGYWEWVLGELRHKSLLHVQTEVDSKNGALLARNRYNAEFAERIAFIDVSDPARTITGDRQEFFGRNGRPASPRALRQTRLSGRVGAGLDPCGAVQMTLNLLVGQESELSFRFGVGRSESEVQTLVRRFRPADAGRAALEGVWRHWNQTLGVIQVETPDDSVNVLANGWLLYQTLSSRVWGRTGFYQSGGAFGFRDQLQDVLALVHAHPTLAREHILRAAAHQFREGDVQHWWHPPRGRGVRTHFSDDYLWLPYATCSYVSRLADASVLDEIIPFLEGRPVKPEEESYYDLPVRSEESATLYQHCVRAIEHGLKFGSHGLPLMGCGDWNDGMNLVGKEGRGESVWLAFFLYSVLTQFAELARQRNDPVFADRCLTQAGQLQQSIEQHAWDGNWYRRAYFDNGDPLGSGANPECQLDSLPQSWSVISGAGDSQRARLAMEAVGQRLVRRDPDLILLFDPPFDQSGLNPGYIKGYPPGVRENGGQYTHGAAWTIMAFALLGEHDRAWELFALVNPIHHSASPQDVAAYKIEPYVLAADVYSTDPHAGRGGWSWYTGSAGWMYRLLVETLLGFNLEGNQLRLTPRLPKSWPSCTVHYRYKQTTYHVRISRLRNGSSDSDRFVLDGQELERNTIPLQNDRREHSVSIECSR
jgi:cyclic beta-1,2-glucan synthetase